MSDYDSLTVRPWDVRKGDRILGTSMVAKDSAQYRGYLYADAVGQQRYALPVSHPEGDREIPYFDDSRVNVLRPKA